MRVFFLSKMIPISCCQDLEARAAHLEECKANLDDPGPLHDCVVWKGGGGGVDGGGGGGEEGWWAAVDTKEDGDITQATAMTDFDKVGVFCRAVSYGVHQSPSLGRCSRCVV